ncbi:unnamed protein product [Ceratitis capitata]|uniref:(Mediterranean fruit fly) hypothetical protein n=1 Tax=Ceratitis capitata TaxID=7213 RepID=A0A811VF37_CERCA|nr:unnamed protein product [Ceratitis capitata]
MSSVGTLRDFQTLGCLDQLKCALGARVYLDLECDKRVTNLEKFYDSDLNLIYLQGKRTDTIVTFVPVLSSQPLNFIEIEKIQKKLSTDASKR